MERQKYFTEEERKAAKRERDKRYRQKHREKILEYQKQYRQGHRDELTGKAKQYYQDHREERAEYAKQWYQDNKEERAEYNKQYYQDNKEERSECRKQYYSTPNGRAVVLASNYRKNDKEYNRGECTLTADWIIDNVFSGQVCHYCGESDWTKLGCDRIDNTKPHTPDNCVPCCKSCNDKKGTTEYQEFMRMIGKVK